MSNTANPGVAYLIEQANKTSVESKRLEIYAAIADAGGVAAQEYLVSEAKKTSVESKLKVFYSLIGRASRV
ncbi:hypothetical protein KSS92_04805 [Pseudomonas atacamensis]|uniref:hypothetical protein n=1 Tax=Pseudomonas atacamensis TaxID=2565368 RepID=UPI001C3D7876|nr:hypothetical protein [Pseudomonas atacamensis]QXH73832.1 hypothetical protein KSS92_04805 [Pseudomonas atacamensis]